MNQGAIACAILFRRDFRWASDKLLARRIASQASCAHLLCELTDNKGFLDFSFLDGCWPWKFVNL